MEGTMRRTRMWAVGCGLTCVTLVSTFAQTPAGPTFEVVSIKPNRSGEVRSSVRAVQPGGLYTATNWTVRMLVRAAYQLQDFQLSGGPGWLNADRFDIAAKA